ncbi:MAG: ATP-binding cassette domain-containing protein, partial [Pseudaminobacter sp.]
MKRETEPSGAHPLRAEESGTDSVIDIQDLRKSYGAFEVLKGIDLPVPRGSIHCLIGPSGSGKSTLLRCVNLLEVPSAGRIVVDGMQLFGDRGAVSQQDLLRIRRKVGMVFQHFNLFPHLTAVENVIVGLVQGLGTSEEEALDRAFDNLARVGLAGRELAYPSELSGGQRQRVGIARALALRPAALLFDEPTSSLDPELAGEVLDVMRELSHEGMTMIIA